MKKVATSEKTPQKEEVRNAKAAILTAARSEFAAKGFAGARIKDIAQAANINSQALYYYFESKEGLYVATLEDSYAHVRSDLYAKDTSDPSPVIAMTNFVENLFDSITSNREIIDLVADENRQNGVHLSQSSYIREINTPFVERFVQIIAEGIEMDLFREEIIPLQAWITVVSMSQFFLANSFTLSHTVGYAVDTEEQIQIRRKQVIELFITGILKPQRVSL